MKSCISHRVARRAVASWVVISALMTTSIASAQQLSTSFQSEQFEPLPAQGYNILNISSSELMPHLRPSAGIFLHYVNDPLQVVPVATGDVDEGGQRLVSHQLRAELLASVGLFNFVELGLALPFVPLQRGDDQANLGQPGQAIEGASLGDVRVLPKVQLLPAHKAAGFGLAIGLPVYIPSGDTETFNSDGKVRVEPRLMADWRHDAGVKIAANLGYQLLRSDSVAQNYTSEDMFRWGLGLELPTGTEIMRVVGSVYGAITTAEVRATPGLDDLSEFNTGRPVEADGGLQFYLPAGLVANAGAGAGLTSGVGAPDFRVFASLSYAPRVADTDGDGLLDAEDGCPFKPEDLEGFEDSDGCPDYDNDNDGLLDVDDTCPLEPEDRDGFEDEDGCPDPDNDKDKVLDVDDACPLEPEDRDDFEDKDGCPDPDNDRDAILDVDDVCPTEPEDEDGFQDEDGCPDPDNDKDKVLDVDDRCPDEAGVLAEQGCPARDRDGDNIPDSEDKCPDKPETYNGRKDEDGCPDGKASVVITESEIKIFQKVFFDTSSDKIKKKSYRLLDTVAIVLNKNPQVTRVRIEGHTDDMGSEDSNLDLSDRRAASVRRYLIERGVDADRLRARGFGESEPLCEDIPRKMLGKRSKKRAIVQCRADNRRVQFKILELNGKPVSGTGSQQIKSERIERIDLD